MITHQVRKRTQKMQSSIITGDFHYWCCHGNKASSALLSVCESVFVTLGRAIETLGRGGEVYMDARVQGAELKGRRGIRSEWKGGGREGEMRP